METRQQIGRRFMDALLASLLFIIHPGHADDLHQELSEAIGQVKQQAANTPATIAVEGGVATPQVPAAQDTMQGSSEQGVVILSHVTESEGMELPREADVILEPTPAVAPQESADTGTPSPLGDTYTRPTACEKNYTQRTLLSPGQSETSTLYDSLYVAEELVPVDPEEVFGAGVKLYPYGTRAGEGVYLRMQVDDVPCVPYRIRITQAARYEDYGLNALRNYSRHPAGKGSLDIRIQRKLYSAHAK